jgi:hypothetical protein
MVSMEIVVRVDVDREPDESDESLIAFVEDIGADILRMDDTEFIVRVEGTDGAK